MTRRLSFIEQETLICFNRAEDMAYVFTYSKAWQEHLEGKLGLKPVRINSKGGRDYEIDKRRIRMPQAPRKLSAEQKAKMVSRLAAARARKAPCGATAPAAQAKSAPRRTKPTKRTGEA